MHATALKTALIARAAQSAMLKKETQEDLAKEIAALALQLEAQNPTAAPTSRPELFGGRWNLLYSTFNLSRETNLANLSFAKLPSAPVTVTRIVQEVAPQTAMPADGETLYDNVVEFIDAAGRPGAMVMQGRYTNHDGHRLDVVFHHVFAVPSDGRGLQSFRADLGVASDAVLSRAIEKTPPTHSSIIYLDEELRINRGSYGGVYVLKRLESAFTPSRRLDRSA